MKISLFFTGPRVQRESLSLNEDEVELSLLNLSNKSLTTYIPNIIPSLVIKSAPIRVDTSKLEDDDARNGSITTMPLQVYLRKRSSNHALVKT